MESSEAFQEELTKHCKKAVDEETFQKLVEKQYEIARKEFEERNKNATSSQPPTAPLKEEGDGTYFSFLIGFFSTCSVFH